MSLLNESRRWSLIPGGLEIPWSFKGCCHLLKFINLLMFDFPQASDSPNPPTFSRGFTFSSWLLFFSSSPVFRSSSALFSLYLSLFLSWWRLLDRPDPADPRLRAADFSWTKTFALLTRTPTSWKTIAPATWFAASVALLSATGSSTSAPNGELSPPTTKTRFYTPHLYRIARNTRCGEHKIDSLSLC